MEADSTDPVLNHRLWETSQQQQKHLGLLQGVEALLRGLQQHLALNTPRQGLKQA